MHSMIGFGAGARPLKTQLPKGGRFLKNNKYSFWPFLGPKFRQKKAITPSFLASKSVPSLYLSAK